MNKKINIDVARFVVSFLVIAIHISPFININQEFNFFFTRILGRIAVPLFFMITGYFVIDGCLKDKNKLKKYTIKILKIYLFCIILYLPINIYMGKFNNISIFRIWNFLCLLKDFFYRSPCSNPNIQATIFITSSVILHIYCSV